MQSVHRQTLPGYGIFQYFLELLCRNIRYNGHKVAERHHVEGVEFANLTGRNNAVVADAATVLQRHIGLRAPKFAACWSPATAMHRQSGCPRWFPWSGCCGYAVKSDLGLAMMVAARSATKSSTGSTTLFCSSRFSRRLRGELCRPPGLGHFVLHRRR